jgi:hypothetical protein
MTIVTASAVSWRTVDDPAAQVGAGAQRVDEVEVVTGHEGGGQGLDDAARTADHATQRAGGVGAEAGTRHPGWRGRSVDGGSAHYASVTYGNVTYETVGDRFPHLAPAGGWMPGRTWVRWRCSGA